MMELIIRAVHDPFGPLYWCTILQPYPDQHLFFWQQGAVTEQAAWCIGFNMAIEFMAKEHRR